MRDFAQYTSRLPSPNFRRTGSPGTGLAANRNKATTPGGGKTTTTRNGSNKTTGAGSPASSSSKSGNSNTNTNNIDGSKDENRLRQGSGGDTDAIIKKLREELNEAEARDASAKAALSKSDSVILDLRSNQRQLKRQLDNFLEERAQLNKALASAEDIAGAPSVDQKEQQHQQQQQQIESLQAHISNISKQLEESKRKQQQQQQEINNSAHSRSLDNNKNAKVGELQVQLDRAHAQILTADMVRKELEDTLEAEQYTWELRVQDQERQIVRLQQDCDTLARDLDQCRSQWKEAEAGWSREVHELKEELSRVRQRLQQEQQQSNEGGQLSEQPHQRDLFQKIHQLETERKELQSCLDEALKELEAVDIELQTEAGGDKRSNNNKGGSGEAQITESLKHLLRWIYQEGPVETRVGHKLLSSLDNNPQEIISLVQKALENWLEATAPQSAQGKKQPGVNGNGRDQRAAIQDLNNQISTYEQELKSKDETSAELRESLKEAVSLLKPLQDAVAKTDEEKMGMQRKLRDVEQDRQSSQDEISQQSHKITALQDQVSSLEEQLDEEKRLSGARESLLKAQRAVSTPSRSARGGGDTPGDDNNDSLAKIKKAREELRRKRETEVNLQKLLKDAQSRFNTLHDRNEDMTARNRELQGQIEQLGTNGEQQQEQQETQALSIKLAQRDEELRILRTEVERLRTQIANKSSPGQNASSAQQKNNLLLENELVSARRDIAEREQVNKVLNKSLKEALGLLKPLQMHLEEAEMEKTEISKELRNLRKRFRQLQMRETDDQSRSTHGGADVSVELIKIKEELKETVRQLELENSQLHDALDDLTDDGRQNNSEVKLRQKLVELNSRYEVTQNKLEDAHVENHALVKALQQKEAEERKRQEEMDRMEEHLRRTELELINAKKIAQSALVKVEELTMNTIERDTGTADGSDPINRTPGKYHNNNNNKNKYAGAYSY